MSEQQISKSKQKRLDQQNARKQQKKQKAKSVLMAIMVPVILVAAVAAVYLLYRSTQIDYGKYLNADGTIQGSTSINIDYQSMTFDKADLLPSDDTVQSDIDSVLESYQYISEDEDRTVEYYDLVSIAYDATLDGEEYDSVSEDEGMDLTVGYGTLCDEVDDAILGRKAGETFTVETAYEDEDDTDSDETDEDAADEAAETQTLTYTVTILGIYDTPELDDEFVQTNLSDTASTAEEYRQSIIDGYYSDNLSSAIEEYIEGNVSGNAVPEKYVANLVKVYKAQNEEQYSYYNSLYYSYLGYYMYDSVYGMYGYDTEEEYDAYVEEQATADTQYFLALQYVYEAEGLTNTQDEIDAYFSEQGYEDSSYSEMVETYGKEYMAHQALQGRVIDYLCDIVTVTE